MQCCAILNHGDLIWTLSGWVLSYNGCVCSTHFWTFCCRMWVQIRIHLHHGSWLTLFSRISIASQESMASVFKFILKALKMKPIPTCDESKVLRTHNPAALCPYPHSLMHEEVSLRAKVFNINTDRAGRPNEILIVNCLIILKVQWPQYVRWLKPFLDLIFVYQTRTRDSYVSEINHAKLSVDG